MNIAWHPAGFDACGLYRMLLPHMHMPGSVFLFQQVGLQFEKMGNCDAVVVQRLYSEANYKALEKFKEKGMKIIYDLDDDLWSVPSYNPVHLYYRKILPGFGTCARLADLITVSTEHLRVAVKNELGKKCPPIEVIENAIDFTWFKPVKEEYKKDRKGKVVLGWAGTATHERDVAKVFDLIPEILKERPNLEFELVGQEMPDNWKEVASQVRIRDFVPVAEWPVSWASWQWDISIAPLEKNKFNLSKSNIKALEAGALKIPCVMTKIAAYDKFCSHSALLKATVMADKKGDWKDRILALVDSEVLRKEVGEEMYRVSKEFYDVEKSVARWREILENL